MKVTVDTKVFNIDDTTGLEFIMSIDNIQMHTMEHIYAEVDKQILENMPSDMLVDLYENIGVEIQKRIVKGDIK